MAICVIDGYENTIRAIVSSNKTLTPDKEVMLDYSKIFVFNKNNGDRIK
jgi:hypothetical protein